MSPGMEAYDEVDVIESFEDFDGGTESVFSFRPGKKVSARGGLAGATLHTPKGQAKLNFPEPVATLNNLKLHEHALNANTQRINLMQNELARLRRELALRRSDPQGQSILPLFLMMKLSKDFKGHTHPDNGKPPTIATDSSGLSSMLPLLMFMPNMFGQSGAAPAASGQQDSMSPLMMMVMMEAL